MNDALTSEVQQKTVNEIMQVLHHNSLPVTPNIRDAVCALMKEVSCQHQKTVPGKGSHFK